MRQYLENCRKVTILVTSTKLHMRFRLTPKSMTLDDLELYILVMICVHFVQYSCIWHAGLLHGKKWSGFLALSKIWIIELKNFVCICVMILLHHFCKKNFWPKFSLTGVLHPGDDKFEFSENFARVRRFGRQQPQSGWRSSAKAL